MAKLYAACNEVRDDHKEEDAPPKGKVGEENIKKEQDKRLAVIAKEEEGPYYGSQYWSEGKEYHLEEYEEYPDNKTMECMYSMNTRRL
jgi:hypothetical protein